MQLRTSPVKFACSPRTDPAGGSGRAQGLARPEPQPPAGGVLLVPAVPDLGRGAAALGLQPERGQPLHGGRSLS